MSSYRHLFFDLDRTLWDFESNSTEALVELAREHELERRGIASIDDFLKNYHRINDELWLAYRTGRIRKEELRSERFHRALLDFGVNDPALAHAFGEEYIRRAPFKTNLVQDTIVVLDYLKGKDYRMHIITNGFEEVQHIKIRNCGLEPYFQEVITSERAGYLKPDKRIFEFALSNTGATAAESLMIGDSLDADVVGAREAGWHQVFFNPDQEEHSEKIHKEIRSLRELLDFL